jgi:hypothetical protein
VERCECDIHRKHHSRLEQQCQGTCTRFGGILSTMDMEHSTEIGLVVIERRSNSPCIFMGLLCLRRMSLDVEGVS